MKKLIFGFLAVAMCGLLAGCSGERSLRRDKLDTRMTQDAYLYFRNLRQNNYAIEEMPEAGIRMYWHKKQAVMDSGRAMLNVGILANWKTDQAYVILQPSPVLGDSIKVLWQMVESDEAGELLLAERNKYNQLEFIADLYDLMNREVVFSIRDSSGRAVPFLEDELALEACRVTLKDYFRLVGVL